MSHEEPAVDLWRGDDVAEEVLEEEASERKHQVLWSCA
jgi:hypothetical protein